MTLTRYLSEQCLTYEAFAKLVGTNRKTVWRWCGKTPEIPRPDMMRRIVEVTEGAVMPNDFYLDMEVADGCAKG